ncbi:MAG: glycoside hydrolase family 78 protein [Candidatus Kariarchaeaceae archaeon]
MKISVNDANKMKVSLVILLFLSNGISTGSGVTGAGTSQNPYQISIPESHTNNVGSTINIVYYEVQLTVGVTYKFEITNINYHIRLTTNSGFQEGTTSGQTGSPKSITYEASSYSGTYRIEALTGGSTASYTLSTAIVPSLVSPSPGAYKSDTTPTFDWDSVSGATEYQLQVDNQNTFTSTAVDITTASTAYTSSALGYSTYYWRVRAKISTYGAWSEVRSFTLFTGPGVPNLVSPANGISTSVKNPDLDWNGVTGATKYKVQLDDNVGFSSPTETTIFSVSSWTVSPWLFDGTYYWRVAAGDVDNKYGSWTSSRTFTVFSPLTFPLPLTPVQWEVIDDRTPLISWSAVTNANEYQLQIDDNTGFPSPAIDTTTVATSYTSPTLADNTLYVWRVRARDSNGNDGFWSETRTFTIDTTKLAAPTLLSPIDAESFGDNTPTFTWNSISGANSYEIEIDDDTSFTSVIQIGYPSSTSYTSPSLSPNTYYWRVRGIEITDNLGEWSVVRSFTILVPIEAGTDIENPKSLLSTGTHSDTLPGPSSKSGIWFSIPFSTETYNISLILQIGDDFDMELYDSDGDFISSATGSTNSIAYESMTLQIFYIHVFPISGSGIFTLSVVVVSPPIAGESMETAISLSIPSSTTGKLPGVSDESGFWYSVVLDEDVKYTFSLRKGLQASYNFDADITLYTSDGVWAMADTIFFPADFIYFPLSSGVYFIHITPDIGDGDFILEITSDETTTTTSSATTSITSQTTSRTSSSTTSPLNLIMVWWVLPVMIITLIFRRLKMKARSILQS